MRRRLAIVLLALFLLPVGSVAALDVLAGNQCRVPADETLPGTLVVLCRDFLLEGSIKGDLLLAAVSASLEGSVEGNVYLLAGELDLRGRVGGDLVFVGPVLRIQPTARFDDSRSNLISASLSTSLAKGVTLTGSLYGLGYQLLLDGAVQRELAWAGQALRLGGAVGGNIDAQVGDSRDRVPVELDTLLAFFRFGMQLEPRGLVVSETASLGGRLRYSAPYPADIRIRVTPPPEVVFTQLNTAPEYAAARLVETSPALDLATWLLTVARELFTILLVGFVLLRLLPHPLQAPLHHLRFSPLPCLGAGVVGSLLAAVLWIVLFLLLAVASALLAAAGLGQLSGIGLLAIAVFNIGGGGVITFLLLHSARTLVALALGRALLYLLLRRSSHARTARKELLTGALPVALLVTLPALGALANVLVLVTGFGAISLALWHMRSPVTRMRQPAALPAPLPRRADNDVLPVIDLGHEAPGMQNLPEGFNWWDDEEDEAAR